MKLKNYKNKDFAFKPDIQDLFKDVKSIMGVVSRFQDDDQISFEYSPIPPSNVAYKGKGIAQTSNDDILKQIMPYMEEGGSAPSLPNIQNFKAYGDRPMTLEEAKLQMQEVKRLADLKPKQLRAQEEELAAIEAKRVYMMDEYNHYINFIDDPLPFTKYNYRVNNVSKEATMRITRNNQPLNLKIYDKFILKMLGFSKTQRIDHSLGE
ncbi:hypothetical protein Tco_0751144 [Tanacetum coccineum]|uniref:Uncharacterized protein n=1 Tax=Tanacetum coccineum TaxID=301880 RepID=A0ABQ4Z6P4_9ASTR